MNCVAGKQAHEREPRRSPVLHRNEVLSYLWQEGVGPCLIATQDMKIFPGHGGR